MRNFLFLILFSIFSFQLGYADPQSEFRHVQSVEDFILHIMGHKERVTALAVEYLKLLKQRDPDRWGNLDENTLRQFAQLHDKPKLQIENAKQLFRYYGKNKDQLVSSDRVRFDRLTVRLESEEAVAISAIFDSKRYHDMEHIVYIADQIDRGKDPIAREEMGRATYLASKDSGLKQFKSDILTLEKKYDTIVDGFRYEDLQERSQVVLTAGERAARIPGIPKNIPYCVIQKMNRLLN